ncbi:MAG TPA: hypothetical protein DC042_14780 [Bacteroidales bacterium]|nr:hypothetical protein [Bacteroidales bacterium]
MRSGSLSGLISFLLLVLITAGCRKDQNPETLPDLTIRVKPAKGLTTDNFTIAVEPVTSESDGLTLFYRWDWDNDGIWDTPFSTSSNVVHRFLKPGNPMVRFEYADGKKQVRTGEVMLLVEQGYSAPKPGFSVNPGKGNILTSFVFDASLTRDDEDSLNQLQFRWDFRGDGHWTVDYSKNPVASYQFSAAGLYNPKLEVKDPAGKTATFSRELLVTMEDSLIVSDFIISDSLIRVGDTVLLDASGSKHLRYPNRELLFSWFLPDRVEWTLPVPEKQQIVIFRQKGPAIIRLKAYDRETRLFSEIAKEIYVADENLPPKAKIEVGSNYGNILTQFYLSSWSSTDDYQAPSELEVRWDFNGDGAWDSPFTREMVAYHQFDAPGEYYIGLQVRDLEGLTSTDRKRVIVSSNTNPTSFFRDPRDGNHYGTVKIGNQWWMSQNLSFTVPRKLTGGFLQWICLMEQSRWCDQVGKLYRIGAVVVNRADEDFVTICPTGWRLPTKDDWETLISSVGGESGARELRFGGKYDFNGLDLGYASFTVLYKGMMPYDTVYNFKETYEKAWFFSTTEPYDINNARTDIWMWNTDRATQGLWVGHGPTNIYMPVRCIKEN